MPSILINGRPVQLVRQGRGQPVVLLHGSAASSAMWRDLTERLSSRFSVLAPDLYGYGGTDPWPGHRDFSLDDEAALVGELLDRLGEPAHLVGHSYGGAVALHVARNPARRLRSLALIEPMACHLLRDGDESDRSALQEFTEVGGRVSQALCRGDLQRGFGFFVDYWNGAGTWDALPATRRAGMSAALPKVALDFHAATTHPSRATDFAAMPAPALLVCGSRTTRPARRVFDRIAQTWPSARVQIISGAGHMSPVTHREQVNDLIEEHLGEATTSRVAAAFAPA